MNKSVHLPYSPNHMMLTGTLQNIVGLVKVTEQNSIMNGTIVKAGDTITAEEFEGQKASVDIYFSDGSITSLTNGNLTINESTKIVQNDNKGIETIIELKLNAGKIWNKVARLASKSEFNVHASGAIAGVRGTEFGLTSTGQLMVASGSVWINEDTDENLVKAMEKTTISDTGFETPSIITDDDINTAYPNRDTVHLTEMVIPYIISATQYPNPNSKVDVYISFNDRTVEESSIDFDGFEVYEQSQTNGYKVMKRGELKEPIKTIKTGGFSYDADKENYVMSLSDYTTKTSSIYGKKILLRAYKNIGDNTYYSAVSWPPTYFFSTPPAEVFTADFTHLNNFPKETIPVLMKKCLGITKLDDADNVTLGYKNNNSLYTEEDEGCWVLGETKTVNCTGSTYTPIGGSEVTCTEDGGAKYTLGESCDSVCSKISLKCEDTTDGAEDWNDTDGSICVALTGGSIGAAITNIYAPVLSTLVKNECKPRKKSNVLCSEPTIDEYEQRICKCI